MLYHYFVFRRANLVYLISGNCKSFDDITSVFLFHVDGVHFYVPIKEVVAACTAGMTIRFIESQRHVLSGNEVHILRFLPRKDFPTTVAPDVSLTICIPEPDVLGEYPVQLVF